jgi:hypothetical protein
MTKYFYVRAGASFERFARPVDDKVKGKFTTAGGLKHARRINVT